MVSRFIEPATRAFAATMFDTGGGIPPARLDWLIADLSDFLGRAGKKTTVIFSLALGLIEWLPLLVIGEPSRFSRLSPELRVRYLEKIDESALAPLLALPKAIGSVVYYEHPEALAETGYTLVPLIESKPASIGELSAPDEPSGDSRRAGSGRTDPAALRGTFN